MLGAIVRIGTQIRVVLDESRDGVAVAPVIEASNTVYAGDMAVQSMIVGFRSPVVQCGAIHITSRQVFPLGIKLNHDDFLVCRAMAIQAAGERSFVKRLDLTTDWHREASKEKSAVK